MTAKLIMLASLVWISPLICKVQNNEAIFKKGLAIGVTLPKEAQTDEEILALLAEFKKENRKWNWIFIGTSLLCIIPKLIWSITLLMLWCYILIVVYNVVFAKYNKKIRKIKEERGWAINKQKPNEVTVNISAISIPKWISPWFFVFLFAISLIPFFLDRSAIVMAISSAIEIVFFYFCYRYCFRTKQDSFNEDMVLSKALTQVRMSYWGRFWLVISIATALFSFSGLMLANSSGWFMFFVGVYTFIIVWESIKCEMKVRDVQAEITQNTATDVSVDDDDKWIWGLFYYNKNDSHFMVNQRTGMGTTINMARPAGKFFMVFTVAIMIGALILPFAFTIDSKVEIALQDEQLHVENGKDSWDVLYEDIESVELLTEYPEKFSRTWGTATDEILKGNFSSTPYKIMNVCLNQKEPPYLLIKVHSGKYYMFGVEEDGVIQNIYDQLFDIIN